MRIQDEHAEIGADEGFRESALQLQEHAFAGSERLAQSSI